jgi:hypothetical protein
VKQEDIIRMAREAGVRDDENCFEFSEYKYLERFAALVRAEEREACAKLAELAEPYQTADLIRKRGQT